MMLKLIAGRTVALCVCCRLLAIFPRAILLALLGTVAYQAQGQHTSGDASLRVSSNLVWIPALVKTQTGDLVYSLKADDFILTDNGIPQRLRLEEDSDSLPLALEIIVENGAAAMKHLPDYRGPSAVLDGIIGNVDHRVAIISFDDKPRLEQDFTANTELAADSLASLKPGDDGAYAYGEVHG